MTTDAMNAAAEISALTPLQLQKRLAASPPPIVIDVRRQRAFEIDPELIPGSLRRLPEDVAAWGTALEPWREIVVYCVHGHEVSQNAAAALRAHGLQARHLAGGIEQWRVEGNATRAFAPPTRWVTRARPKIDRIACPWLVRRFIDPSAEFFYVPSAEVHEFAAANNAIAFDIAGAPYTHDGADCSFDAFIRKHALAHPALDALATIVRAADTSALELAPEAPGLLSISQGLSALFADDHTMLKWGMLVYDSLYARCREGHWCTLGAKRLPSEREQ